MGCMVLCRTFHTAPEQGWELTPIVLHCSGSGPSPGHGQCDYTIALYIDLQCMPWHMPSNIRHMLSMFPTLGSISHLEHHPTKMLLFLSYD